MNRPHPYRSGFQSAEAQQGLSAVDYARQQMAQNIQALGDAHGQLGQAQQRCALAQSGLASQAHAAGGPHGQLVSIANVQSCPRVPAAAAPDKRPHRSLACACGGCKAYDAAGEIGVSPEPAVAPVSLIDHLPTRKRYVWEFT